MTPGLAGRFSVARLFRRAGLLLFASFFLAASLPAGDLSLSNLLAQGDLLDQRRDTPGALEVFLKAGQLAPTNAQVQCRLVKQYCDMMHQAKTEAEKKDDVQKALACGLRATAADPQSPQAHVCLAVSYAKMFPYCDNQTKVNYSRLVKAEAEKALELDPKYNLAYHLLGRWNCQVANMNLFLSALVKIAYGGLPKASNQSAIDNFKKAIELAPKRVIHHLQLAYVYHIIGKENLAAPELQTCRDLTPFDLDDADAQQIAFKVIATGRWPSVF